MTDTTQALREALESCEKYLSDLSNALVGASGGRTERQLQAVRATLAASPQPAQEPIDMVLHCPACGLQHIDAPEAINSDESCGVPQTWLNPPHRSHLCHGCGHIWRPADVPTNGVQAVKTKGKADSASPQPAPAVQPEATSDEVIELTAALEIRAILEAIKQVAALYPPDLMPTPFQSGWQGACEEIFYLATGQQWHMDEDDSARRVQGPTAGQQIVENALAAMPANDSRGEPAQPTPTAAPATPHKLGPLPEPDLMVDCAQGFVSGLTMWKVRAYALAEVQRAVAAERAACRTALNCAKAALLEMSPCAHPDCEMTQKDYANTALGAIDRALGAPTTDTREQG